MTGIALSLLSGAALAVILAPAAQLHVHGRDVRLSDVGSIVGQATVADPVIARIPAGRDRVALTRTQIAGLIRRAVPGAEVSGRGSATLTIAADLSSRQAGACFELVAPKAAGDLITRDAAEQTDCRRNQSPAPVSFDRETGGARASGELLAGTYLGKIRLVSTPAVRRGDKVLIGATAGPVLVQRTVVALQDAARPGERLFVRDGDGAVFAATPEGKTQ